MPDQTKGLTYTELPSATSQPRLSVIGLGKLGTPMAAVFACAGYRVTGADRDASLVELLGSGKAPFEETDLAEFISDAGEMLSVTTSTRQAVLDSDISFVIVPTPSGEDGLFLNHFVLDAVREIGAAMREKDTYHLVVITSTVVPGATEAEIRPVLEKASGRKIGAMLGLGYSPEFIALGSVIRDMQNPDVILIGASDQKAGDLLEGIYRRVAGDTPAYHRMNFVNAELAKIAVNTFVTTKISYANMLSAMCDELAGADIDTISAILGSDSRIGPKYLKGGAAYGGPCFPRDNKAFTALADQLGVAADIAAATDAVNGAQTNRMLRIIDSAVDGSVPVAVLGLAYKTDTDVTEESAGIALASALEKRGYQVASHDPGVDNRQGGFQEAINSADIVCIMTPWPDYASLPDILAQTNRSVTVIDPWRMFAGDAFGAHVTYIALGRG